MSEKANKMKDMKLTVSLGKGDKVTWQLKDISYRVPTTIEGWTEWIGKDKVQLVLETFDSIRRQDAARRAKLGGKNTAPLSDAKIRTEIVPNFRLFERTRVAATPRIPTPEEAKTAIVTQVKSKDEMLRLIAELQASAEAMPA